MGSDLGADEPDEPLDGRFQGGVADIKVLG